MGIFPPNSKKRKGKESYIIIVYITFNIAGGKFLVFFDDELTTFKTKIIDLFVNYKFEIFFNSKTGLDKLKMQFKLLKTLIFPWKVK